MKTIDSKTLRIMIESAANNLKNQKKAVNDLNIFPVPDGDTGTNMSMTFSGAAAAIAALPDDCGCGEILHALSKAALRNARGNSGVILSQIIRGISKGSGSANELSVSTILDAALYARKTAYDAVMKPTEGTILTVVRNTAEFAEENAENYSDADKLLCKLCEAANESLKKTPTLLPVLAKAGVVDAGGKGITVLLEGAVYALSNGVAIKAEDGSENTSAATLKSTENADIKFLYCTEFIINKTQDKKALAFKEAIKDKGDCMLVIEDDEIVKVHIHTNHPGKVIEEALKLGELTNLKIDNMKYQHEERIENAQSADKDGVEMNGKEADCAPSLPPKKYGFVAVSAGDGIGKVFKELGADEIVEGGQTMNPSTQDILDAVGRVNAENIFILPNNKNIILAAEQVQKLTDKNIFVIKTKNVPQGISAMMGFSDEMEPEDNVDSMNDMFSEVKCGQITFAARDTVLDGVDIHEGDIMGLSGSEISVVGDDCKTCAEELIETLVDDTSGVISLYYGSDVSEKDANALLDDISKKYEDMDVSLIYGGQPIYYYIISVE